MTVQVNIYEAKTTFSKLIKKAIAGEEIVIALSGKPVAKLVPLQKPCRDREPGSAMVRFGTEAADFHEVAQLSKESTK